MPTYDYECPDCGHRFERFHAMSARPVRKCPECGGKVRRLISGGAAVHSHSAGGRGSDALPCDRDTPCDRCPHME